LADTEVNATEIHLETLFWPDSGISPGTQQAGRGPSMGCSLLLADEVAAPGSNEDRPPRYHSVKNVVLQKTYMPRRLTGRRCQEFSCALVFVLLRMIGYNKPPKGRIILYVSQLRK